MLRRAAGLSARQVMALRLPGLFSDGRGLYLQVAPSGAKSWVYRFQIAGRRRDMGLGSADIFSLAEAREKAAAARKLVANGVDPIDVRRAERLTKALDAAKAMTFRQCAEAYIASHRAGWSSPKHEAQWSSTLQKYAYPHFGNLSVQGIDVGLVMKAIEPIWATKSETANRVRGRIESVLDWATTRGYRRGENPARWRGHLENLLPKKTKVRAVEHLAAIPYTEIGAFLVALREQGGIAARALEFGILTATRTGEVMGARWDEVDLVEKVWTISARRMKGRRDHRIPLSSSALGILREMEAIRIGELIFPGTVPGRPLSNMAFLMLLRRMGRGDLTAHGFRSTFSDWCAERTAFPAEVREMALAHAVGDKVEAAYRRGDLFEKRRQLAEAWARFCAAIVAGGDKVVPLGRKGTA